MSPAPARLSHPGGADCAAHGVRIDSLDEQTASLRRKQESTHDAVGELRTEIALLRQAVETLTAVVSRLEEARTQETQKRLDRSSTPTRAQVQTVILGALLAMVLGWVGANLLPRLPGAPSAQAQASHTH